MALQEKVVLWGQEEWRKQREKNEFGFYYASFCIEHDSESEVGMQQCHRKVFEGRSSARQFPSLATQIHYTSRISDGWTHTFCFTPMMHCQLCSRMKNQTRVTSKETVGALSPHSLESAEVWFTVCIKPWIDSEGQVKLKRNSLGISTGEEFILWNDLAVVSRFWVQAGLWKERHALLRHPT